VQEVTPSRGAQESQPLKLVIQTLTLTLKPDLNPNPDLTLALTHPSIGVQEVTPSRGAKEPQSLPLPDLGAK